MVNMYILCERRTVLNVDSPFLHEYEFVIFFTQEKEKVISVRALFDTYTVLCSLYT